MAHSFVYTEGMCHNAYSRSHLHLMPSILPDAAVTGGTHPIATDTADAASRTPSATAPLSTDPSAPYAPHDAKTPRSSLCATYTWNDRLPSAASRPHRPGTSDTHATDSPTPSALTPSRAGTASISRIPQPPLPYTRKNASLTASLNARYAATDVTPAQIATTRGAPLRSRSTSATFR